MEPNNFEKDFRDKLNQRQMEPSNRAWDRLDAMLTVAEEKKPVRFHSVEASKKRWLYIAASVVGLLLVSTFFFNQKKNEAAVPEKTVVVEEKVKNDSDTKTSLQTIDSSKTAIAISEEPSTSNKWSEERNNYSTTARKTNKVKSNANESQITESSIIIKNNQEQQSISTKTSVAESPKNENVEHLLESAEKTVVAENSVKPKSKVKINASDLLHQVDGELELSFREKVITKVNKNYQTVKVALANRNQQE